MLKNPILHAVIIAGIGIVATLCFPRHAPDTDRYLVQARNLFVSGTYSLDGKTQTARDMPGLPVLFCIAMFAKADPLVFVRVLNGLFLGGIAYLTALCFLQINQGAGKETTTSILLMYICGLFPTLLGSTLFVLTEIFATALFLCCNYFLFFSERRNNVVSMVIAAVSCSAAFYFRPVLLLYPLFLVPTVLGRCNGFFGHRLRAKHYSLFLALCTLLTLPWGVRNYYAFGQIVPGSTASGWCLYIGTSKEWKAEVPDDYPYNEKLVENYDSLNEAEASSVLTRKALGRIREDFSGWIKLAGYKAWNFWMEVPGSKQQIGSKWIVYAIKSIHWSLIALFLAGAVTFRKKIWLRLMFLPILYMFLPHILLFAMPRFRIPIDPYLILIAFVFVLSLLSREVDSGDSEGSRSDTRP